jgi:hypothetical protein
MSDTVKTLIGTWNVAFDQYRWTYTFYEGGTVTWRDIYNGKTGGGNWSDKGSSIGITWKGSKTKETWPTPIKPAEQAGNLVAEWGSGWSTATKKQNSFDGFAPEGQIDAYACWAACLSWYTKVQPDIPTISQRHIVNSSDPRTWAANGAITPNGLMMISLPNVFLQRSRIVQAALDARVRARTFPMLIAFSSGPMGGHVNVIHGFDEGSAKVAVMEPWFPDPTKDKSYDLMEGNFFKKGTGAMFKFTGQMTMRPLSYYTSRPMGGEFIVGHRA